MRFLDVFNAKFALFADDLKSLVNIVNETDLRLFQDNLDGHASFCSRR